MPDAIAHYKILDRIGAGGLGEVYRARDTKLGRTVALRVLPDSLTGDRLQQLLEAARSTATLSHPNIAALFEIGEDGPARYLAFEFVPGEPLTAVIRGRALNLRRAVDFSIQLADALAEAEMHEIVHGDIRPDTIVITPKDRAKFLNFGLTDFTAGGTARRAANSASGSRSASAIAAYMSPEERSGGAPDARSDIFALGAVIYEMMTGRQAARGRPRSVPVPVSESSKGVPKDLDAIISKALATDVERRYQSAATLAAELRSVAAILDARAVEAEATFDPPRAGRRRGRPLVAAILLLAIAGLAFWIWQSGVWRLLE